MEELLKQLLEGTITAQEYAEKLKALDKGTVLSEEEINKKIQSEVDKVRTAYVKEVNDLKEENKGLLDKVKSTMTDAEVKKLEKEQAEQKAQEEIAKREAEIQEREQKVALAENKLKATSLLNKYGLNEADENGQLLYMDFILNSDEKEMDKRCLALKTQLDKTLEVRVAERFKENGRTFDNGGSGGEQKSEALKFAEKIANTNQQVTAKEQKANEYYFGKNN